MKRISVLLFILLFALPLIGEVESSFGPAVFLDFAVPVDEVTALSPAEEHFGIEDFTIGVDYELILELLQVGVIATVTPAAEWIDEGVTIQHPGFLNLVLDGGLLLESLFLRLGLGAGVTLRFPIIYDRPDKPIDMGINIKGNIDFDLGPIAFRVNIITFLDLVDTANLTALPVNLGASVLFDL